MHHKTRHLHTVCLFMCLFPKFNKQQLLKRKLTGGKRGNKSAPEDEAEVKR